MAAQVVKKISKNNPNARDNTQLVVYCSKCKKELKIVKQVSTKGTSKFIYKCMDESCGFQHDIRKGSYKDLEHQWMVKK
jgi:hypothetical protein